jgi:hypothetical protein
MPEWIYLCGIFCELPLPERAQGPRKRLHLRLPDIRRGKSTPNWCYTALAAPFQQSSFTVSIKKHRVHPSSDSAVVKGPHTEGGVILVYDCAVTRPFSIGMLFPPYRLSYGRWQVGQQCSGGEKGLTLPIVSDSGTSKWRI